MWIQIYPMGPEEGITGKCLVMTTPDAERTMYVSGHHSQLFK